MNGREQPYIDGNGTGVYQPTFWVDDVPGIQVGTPQDEQNFNNIEGGVNGANLSVEFLTEVVKHNQDQLNNTVGEVIELTLTNTQDFYFNNSVKTVALSNKRDTLDYVVDVEIQGDTVNVGDIVIFDKQMNGFKVKFTGSAKTVALKLFVHGGNAA